MAKTAFATALDAAALAAWELAALDTPKARKQSAKGFLDEVQKIHRGSRERAIILRADIAARPDLEAIASFVRGLSRALATDHYPNLPRDLSRLARTFGTEVLRGVLADAHVTLADAVVVAIEDAIERTPEAFGTATDFYTHQRKVDAARAKLDDAKGRMAAALTMADVTTDTTTLSPGERARGLVRMTLRSVPSIAVGPGWEDQLIAHQLRAQRAAA